MKKFKKIMAILVAAVMIVAMAVPAWADPAYSITVTNSNPTITIAGKTYTAYKLFDMTYNSAKTAYAYRIDSDGDGAWAWSTLISGLTADANGVYTNDTYGIKLVPSAGDSTVYSVLLKDSAGKYPGESGYDKDNLVFDGAKARALADALQSGRTSAAVSASSTVADNAENTTINLTQAGYYMVYGTAEPTDNIVANTEVVAAVALTSTDPSATVNPKASVPTLEKKITAVKEGNEVVSNAILDANGKAAVAKIGSKVSYKLTSVVPDMRGYTSYDFSMTDTMTNGLTFDGTSLKVYIYNEGKTEYVTANTPAISSSMATYQNTETATSGIGGATFKLTFPNFINLKNYTGYTIEVTYDATVDSDALSTNYENNTANLTYSNNPYDSTKKNTTPNKTTYIIDLNLDVDKVAEAANGTKLEGATFKLYKLVPGTVTYTQATQYDSTATYYSDNDGTDTVVSIADENAYLNYQGTLYTKSTGASTKKYYKWDNNAVTWVATQAEGDNFTTDTDGDLTQQVRGLDQGTYYFEETVAPQGYNLLADPVEVTITATESNDEVTYTSSSGAAITNGTVSLATASNNNQPVAKPTIVNIGGTKLPETGGMGTTVLYIVGGMLIVLAGAYLFFTRKKTA